MIIKYLSTIKFAKKLKEEITDNVDDVVKKIKIPVMILQGKEDDVVPMDWASNLDKMLSESGNMTHILTYYEYMGNFFGKLVNDGIHNIHYEADKEVLDNIKRGKKIIFIHGVCGTGKSAIALNIARALGRASVVVPVKALQKQ